MNQASTETGFFPRTVVLVSILAVGWFASGRLQPNPWRPAYLVSGSMAESFWGPCFQVQCADCGFSFRCDAEREDLIPRDRRAVCPNCGYSANRLTRDQLRGGQPVWYDASILQQRSPARWQVVALRSADDEQRGHIKRIAGLPGDWMAIRDGELYANQRLLRKSLDEQRMVAVLVHDATYQATRQGYQPRWQTVNDSSGWRRSESGFSFRPVGNCTGQFDWLEYRHRPAVPLPLGAPPYGEAPINDNYGYNQGISRDLNDVRDVMLGCWVRLIGSGLLALSVSDGNDRIEVVIATADSMVSVRNENGVIIPPKPVPSLTNSTRRFELSVFDRQFLLAIDGQTMVRFKLPTATVNSPTSRPLRIGARNLQARISELRILRDTFYLNPRGLALPWQARQRLGPDEFFLLGDNPPLSVDSRNWANPGVARTRLLGEVRGGNTHR